MIEEPNQKYPTKPKTSAKIMPLRSPTRTSRRITRQTLEVVKSLVAMARTATVSDCVPALPPIDATIGIKTASATNCAIVASNIEMTKDAIIAVAKFTANQGKRPRVVSKTLSDSEPSPTPARRIISSSYSSSSTIIASSMVITPTSRSSASTTGAEMR